MEKVSRRKVLGFAVAGAAATACTKGPRQDPYARNRNKPLVPGAADLPLGHEAWVSTVCGQCLAGCGIRVRVAQGRAVKVEGNLAFPINKGSVGPKGQSGLEMLYHRDRLKGPMKRDGARGGGKWTPMKWEEAISEIAQKLNDVRAKGNAKGVVVLDGEPRGPMNELWGRFLQALGSPNHVNHRATTDGGKVLANFYMSGAADLPAYDWSSTRYVLGMGTALLESWCQTMHVMRASSELRAAVPGKRVKFVQVTPRYSTTALKADEWVPIEPATYGALALGLSRVLVERKLYDAKFVETHCFGFEDWKDASGKAHRGYKDLLLKDWPLERVEKVTGVDVATISRLAEEMAEHSPAIAVADGGAAAATNGLGTAMAIHGLNALLGNLERPGGMLIQRPAPLAPWPQLSPDEVAKTGASAVRLDGAGTPAFPLGLGAVQALPDAVLSGGPYPVEALFLYRSNPAFSKPGGAKWKQAFEKAPLVVSFSPLPDESTLWADYVLPDHTYFERWELVEPAPAFGNPVVGLRQPVVPPQLDTRQTGDVVIQLGRAMGGAVAQAFPWDSYKDALKVRLTGLLKQEASSTLAQEEGELLKGMGAVSGWWKQVADFEKWNVWATPSGKFEFYSQALASKLAQAFGSPEEQEKELAKRGVATRGDELCMPHWEPAVFSGEESQYPFVLLPYRAVNYAEGGVRHIRRLVELPLVPGNPWKERVELSPADATRLKLKNGDPVLVETTAGKRTLTALVRPGVPKGMAALPLGYGAWPPRPGEEPTGAYPLLAAVADPLAGIFAAQCTRARIGRAS